ncbi:MAG: ABC transporter substrate-binding protein [Chloroflexi bacterium]|uniref:ABC transporter substrate-binding protein n=1 Tax=Candidatus Chlorohelix allophototropha TaxID=3003348 RepID=A0A8T7M3P5_9CHLR|nr:ABC transporter substrate-binding protein [Chloroflexota bacterium]WJW65955.1 ABC transporter substrate-binding protein [Chloroflexota bacterium L227-S17]
MKKSYLTRWFGTALLILTVLLVACGDNTATSVPATTTTKVATTSAATTASALTTTAAATTAATFPLELKDDAGRTVKLAKAATKIVSLAPSSTEILYALGLAEQVVGVDQFSNYPPEAAKKEQVGSFADINLEKVISLSPDLVLATSLHLKTVVPTLEQRNINVIVFDPKDLAGVVANIKLVGKAAGVPDKGDTEAKNFQNRLDNVASKVKNASKKVTVFFDLGDLYTVAAGSFLNDMIEKAGGVNIAPAGTNPYPQLTNEVIIAADPQVIILSSGDGGFVKDDAAAISTVTARAGWDKLTAVKNKNIRTVIADLTNRPGPRAAEGVEQIALALYPDLFK